MVKSEGGICHKCYGGKLIVLGLILLANVYWTFLEWWTLIGILFIVGGLIKMFKPSCGHVV